MTSEVERITTTKLLKMAVPPARTRGWVDDRIINEKVCLEIGEIEAKLKELEKNGGPTLAPKPKVPSRSASESEHSFYTIAKSEYDESKKVYDNYANESYNVLKRAFSAYEKMSRLRDLLEKEKLSSVDAEMVTTLSNILSSIVPNRTTENDEEYEKLHTKFAGERLSEFTSGIDLSNPDAINGRMTDLLEQHEMIRLFIRKAELSKSKIRINEYSMITVSTVAEICVREMIQNAIYVATDAKVNQKIIKPDHIISPEVENMSMYPVFSKLARYLKIRLH